MTTINRQKTHQSRRPRLSLGEEEKFSIPELLDIQKRSHALFLQADKAPEDREDVGLNAALASVFPIVSYSGQAELHYVSYNLGKPVFDVAECRLRGLTYGVPLKVKMRLVIYDKEASGTTPVVKDIKEQEVYFGNIPNMTNKGKIACNAANAFTACKAA